MKLRFKTEGHTTGTSRLLNSKSTNDPSPIPDFHADSGTDPDYFAYRNAKPYSYLDADSNNNT